MPNFVREWLTVLLRRDPSYCTIAPGGEPTRAAICRFATWWNATATGAAHPAGTASDEAGGRRTRGGSGRVVVRCR